MDFSVTLCVFLLSILNLTLVSTGQRWWGPNRRVSAQVSLSSNAASESAPKYKRPRPPLLNRPRLKTGIERRTSGNNRDMVHFYLYPDPKDTTYREEIVVGNNVSLSSYRPDYYPIILIHGYMQNYSNVYPQRTKDAYLRQGFKANIIIVDWQGHQPGYGIVKNIARGYPKASKQVGKMAKQINDFLMFLITERVLKDPTTTHLVGYGLGCQIAGVTGHNFKRNTGLQLGRITALDPSGLQYHYTAISEKLDTGDAAFVDVIHTTTAPFGIGSSIGNVDFYPNGGGPSQPGCESLLDFMKDVPGMEGSSCAHIRAYEYFTDSIYNKEIYSCQSSSYLLYKMKTFCSKPVAFGQHTSKTARGNYFLELVHKG